MKKKVSLRYLAVFILILVLFPIALSSVLIIEQRASDRKVYHNQHTIKEVSSAFHNFIQRQFDLVTVFAEEAILLRDPQTLTLEAVQLSMQQASLRMKYSSTITDIKLLTSATATSPEYQEYLNHVSSQFLPIQTIECQKTCVITVVIPVRIENENVGVLFSSDLASFLLAFSQIHQLDLVLLTPANKAEAQSANRWQSYLTPVITNPDNSRQLLSQIKDNFDQLMPYGKYFKQGERDKFVWSYQYKIAGKESAKLLFIEDQTQYISEQNARYHFALVFLSTVILIIFVSGYVATINPVNRLIKLAKAVNHIGSQKYQLAIEQLTSIKSSRFMYDEITLVHNALTSAVLKLKKSEQDLQQSNDYLSYIAHHDKVTSLLNRHAFSEQLTELEQRHNQQVTLFLIDIEGFTALNENLGHEVGDRILQQVGERLTSREHKAYLTYRFGGDEFIILHQQLTAEQDIRNCANELLTHFEQPINIDNLSLTIGISVGVATANSSSQDFAKLLRQTDLALHQAKLDKQIGYKLFHPKMEEKSKLLFRIQSDFSSSLANDEFYLCYQPMLDLNSERLVKMEALIRWQHPHIGQIYPDQFIPVLEDTGQIEALTDWILVAAANKIKTLDELGLEQVTVSINISAHQATDLSYIDKIFDIISLVGVPPARFQLEITETSVVSDFNKARVWVEKAKQVGFSVAMDDFGTGYSSLSYLTTIAFDTIKLDRSLITNLVHDSVQKNVIKSIVTMVKNLGHRIVVEGVEEYNQFTLLKELGCHVAQGYLIARPLDDIALQQALKNYVQKSSWFENS